MIIINFACLLLAFSSCNKENNGTQPAGQAFRATTEQDNSKTHLDGLNVLWTAHDQIKVAAQDAPSTAYTFELTKGEDSQSGTFYTGTPHPSTDFFDESEHDYVAVYPASGTIVSGTQVSFVLPSTQTRSATQYFGEGVNPMVAVSANKTLQFKNVCGGIGFQLTGTDRVLSLRLTSKDETIKLCGTYTVNISETELTGSMSGGSNSIELTCDVQLSGTPQWFYFMLPAVNLSSGFIMEAFGEGGVLLYRHDGPAFEIKRNKIRQAQSAAHAKIGAIHSAFTINANGDKVYFSKGNLQYIGSATTPYWKFADNQWDKLSTNASSAANVNRDLFGWGTSGWNSGNKYYYPWATACAVDDRSLYGPLGESPLTGTNSDWGIYNAISNGGGVAAQWRTLSDQEWTWIISQRSASTINGISNARMTNSTVNGVYGMVLFPDNFVYPSDVSLPSPGNINVQVNSYMTEYDAAAWSKMEAAGAVFLPATGCRYGTEIQNLTSGYYWSSTNLGDGFSIGLSFGPNPGYVAISGARFYGISVRLVSDL